MACPESGPVVVDQEPDNSVAHFYRYRLWSLGTVCSGICRTDLCAGGACEGNECTDRNDCDPGMVCIDSECVSPRMPRLPRNALLVRSVMLFRECIGPNGATNTGDGGNADGNTTGSGDGAIDGSDYDGGSADGSSDGSTDGSADGSSDGSTDGSADGSTTGGTQLMLTASMFKCTFTDWK